MCPVLHPSAICRSRSRLVEGRGAHPAPYVEALRKPHLLSALGEDGLRWQVLVDWHRVAALPPESGGAPVGLPFAADCLDLPVPM